MSRPNMRILREKLLLNNLKHRKTLITKSGGSKGSIGKKRVKSYYDNKEECKKLEIRNLQTQIEHLKKENIDLKSKAK